MHPDPKKTIERLLILKDALSNIYTTNYVAHFNSSQLGEFEELLRSVPYKVQGYQFQKLLDKKTKSAYYAIYAEDIEIHIEQEDGNIVNEYRQLIKGGGPEDLIFSITISHNKNKSFKEDLEKLAKILSFKGFRSLESVQKMLMERKGGIQ